jgi:hypothetical protein
VTSRLATEKIDNLFFNSAVLTKKVYEETVSRYAFGAELAGMAAERVDDGLVAVHGYGCQREDAGVHTHVLKFTKS